MGNIQILQIWIIRNYMISFVTYALLLELLWYINQGYIAWRNKEHIYNFELKFSLESDHFWRFGRWEDNIKMGFEKITFSNVNCFGLVLAIAVGQRFIHFNLNYSW